MLLMLQAERRQITLSKTKTKYPNSLVRYRERLGLTPVQLARLAGCKHGSSIRRMEMGHVLPGVVTVLRLSAALRAPVEFLYQETFKSVREEVRALEGSTAKGQQGVLPIVL
jgi:DNA-binding XRE family transcriptional regulator